MTRTRQKKMTVVQKTGDMGSNLIHDHDILGQTLDINICENRAEIPFQRPFQLSNEPSQVSRMIIPVILT